MPFTGSIGRATFLLPFLCILWLVCQNCIVQIDILHFCFCCIIGGVKNIFLYLETLYKYLIQGSPWPFPDRAFIITCTSRPGKDNWTPCICVLSICILKANRIFLTCINTSRRFVNLTPQHSLEPSYVYMRKRLPNSSVTPSHPIGPVSPAAWFCIVRWVKLISL